LQAYIDYIKTEREVLELLLQRLQGSLKGEDHRIAKEVREKMIADSKLEADNSGFLHLYAE
jgi:hypothetical protein